MVIGGQTQLLKGILRISAKKKKIASRIHFVRDDLV
jgi:hypothetical protein